MRVLGFIAVVLIFLEHVNGFGNNFWKLRQKLESYRRHKKGHHHHELQSESIPRTPLPTPTLATVEHFLEQPLDHFDPRVKGTYKQRYWANLDYWGKPDGPVFLYIGGEGGLSPLVVTEGEHVDLAKKYGALIVAVEHRFYGASINNNGLQLDQIQYLSSQQGLSDLATFHQFASKQYNLTEANRWICFGGSYPGALSAWFRIKYPHLVYGAVASSAPVQAVVNFEGYNSVVAASLGNPIVNGSEKCAANIRSAFKKVDQMLEGGQLQQLAKDFSSCEPIKSEDIFQFVSNLADVFMGTVQYNNEMPGMNVATICQNMTKAGVDPYQLLAALNKQTLASTEQKCADNSWKSFLKQVMNTTVVKEDGAVGIRQWLYQTCTQFGFYQTCDKNTTCPFSRHQNLGPNLDVCNTVFGITPQQVYDQVAFTNSYYGSDQPKGTRIIFVNGSIDPWHALSVLKDLGFSETAVYIKGTAHCANMSPSEASDPDSLRTAREVISLRIGWWLQDARHAVDSTLRFKPSL